jgi:hypothetical protein
VDWAGAEGDSPPVAADGEAPPPVEADGVGVAPPLQAPTMIAAPKRVPSTRSFVFMSSWFSSWWLTGRPGRHLAAIRVAGRSV